MELKQIQVDQIDLKDRLYLMDPPNPPELNWEDVMLVGSPVWLQEKEAGCYRIVDGFGLLNYLILSEKATAVSALVFEEASEISIWQRMVLKKITENDCAVFAVMESLSCLMNALGLESSPVELNEILKKAGLPPKSQQRERLNQIIQLLLDECGFADLYSLKYKDLLRLAKLPKGDLQNYSQLLEGLTLRGNKLTSMVQLLEDLSRGYNVNSADLLKNETLRAIQKDVPLHQRYKLFKNELLGMRWPQLNSVSEKWQKTLGKLALSDQIQIGIDPYFETDHLEINLKAASYQEFSQLQEELAQKSTSKQFQDLFDFI